MPKTNDGGGATYAGFTGVVEHADGRLSELDPERNLDGTLVEGEHPDHAEGEEREGAFADPTGVRPIETEEQTEEEVASSPGSSSQTPSRINESSNAKSASKRR